MENKNIKKINTLGKVSRIMLIIMKVACIIGIVACLVSSVIVLTLPKDDIMVATGTASAEIIIDDSSKFIIENDLFRIGGMKVSTIGDLEECDEDIDIFDTNIKLKIDETESDGKKIYNIDAELDSEDSKSIILAIFLICIADAVISAVMLVIVIFAGKFAKALEICKSPFEDNVIKSMKNFAFSLIPLAVVYLIAGGINMTAVVLVIAVIIFSYIFKYGAELQKESDETI